MYTHHPYFHHTIMQSPYNTQDLETDQQPITQPCSARALTSSARYEKNEIIPHADLEDTPEDEEADRTLINPDVLRDV